MAGKSGGDTIEDVQLIVAQPQARSTCPVCLDARQVTAPFGGKEYIISWPACRGTVPAGPQADLAAWREDHALLLEDIEYEADIVPLQRHLAAMPPSPSGRREAQPDARFESIAVQHNREVRIRTALLAYRDSDDGDLDALDVAVRAILRELLPPQAQPDAELLKALKSLVDWWDGSAAVGSGKRGIVKGYGPAVTYLITLVDDLRAAIAQAEQGAAG